MIIKNNLQKFVHLLSSHKFCLNKEKNNLCNTYKIIYLQNITIYSLINSIERKKEIERKK